MAYQKKYWFQFADITERIHVVELWQNTTDTITSEEIKGHMNPFSVEMPEIDHKFQVVRGCGCQINLLSETDMKFFAGLYHVNPTDFMVKHYIDGVINFYGYLNAEMMSEPYDIDFNYQVSLTGNDGFSLMDRFSFIQLDESNYTGIKSKFELLQIIFAKIGLPFVEYRIAIATTFTGYSGDTDSSILHESFVDCANFYDEDDKPMTLRAVVESILAPYGAHIRAESGNIYITDIHSLASLTDVVYKRFTMSTGAYAGFIAIPNIKAIADIGYLGTGHSIERSGGVNRQVVSYSPYPTKTILEESLIGIDEFETVPSDWSAKDGYYYKTLEGNSHWVIDPAHDVEANPPTFEMSYYEDMSQSIYEENIYIRIPRYPTNPESRIMYLSPQKYLNIFAPFVTRARDTSKKLALLIEGEIMVKTKLNPYADAETSVDFTSINNHIKIKIGDKYFRSNYNNWGTDPEDDYIVIQTYTESKDSISDKFVDIGKNGKGFLAILQNFTAGEILEGNLSIEFHSQFAAVTNSNLEQNPSTVRELWIKNLSVKIVNFDGSEIKDNDIEYIGLLNRVFQDEGEKIKLTCGTDSQFADRGKILKSDGTNYSDITQWTRNAQSFKIEELLLGSVSSNYRAGFVTLSNMKLKNSFSLQNILTDTFIGSAKMMVKSANINYQDNVVECSLEEILPDELIIVKDATVT